ncbi:MAG: fasciclin domain-containing protein [Burkholderiales bacterium]
MTTFASFTATRRSALAAALVTVLAGCASVPAPVNLADTIAKTPSLSTLQGLVTSSGLTSTLQGVGPYTVFAPNNEAFKAVPAKTMEDLAKHPDKLKAVLTYHVIAGKSLAADVKNSNAKTLHGADIAISKAGEFITVESAATTQTDILATNGVVHIIDTVLLPPVKK